MKDWPDHAHLLLSVPPKYSIVNTVGFLKGKSAIRINRDLGKVKGSLYGRAFWSRGYCASTVGWSSDDSRVHPEPGETRA